MRQTGGSSLPEPTVAQVGGRADVGGRGGPDRGRGPPAPMTGRTSRDGVAGPRWTVSVTGSGDGQMIGQAWVATLTRIRWPGSQR